MYLFLTLATLHRLILTCLSSLPWIFKELGKCSRNLCVSSASRGERIEEGGEPVTSAFWAKFPYEAALSAAHRILCSTLVWKAGAKEGWQFQPSGQSPDERPMRRLKSKSGNWCTVWNLVDESGCLGTGCVDTVCPGFTLNTGLRRFGLAEILMEYLNLARQLLLTYLRAEILWFFCLPSIFQLRAEHGKYLYNKTEGMLACWLGLVQTAEDRNL